MVLFILLNTAVDKKMKQINLNEYVDGSSQQVAADQLDVYQATISKMMRVGRNIVLTVDPTGSVHDAYEIKRVGKFRKTNAA